MRSMTDENQRDGWLDRRREVWGDDPEEIDASAVVAEDGSGPGNVWEFIRRSGKRIGVTVAGFAVLAAGVAMLALPGPGLITIIAGLAILSTEYVWAQRLLKTAKERAERAKDAVLGKNGKNKDAEAPAEETSDPT
jgi:hypothetical protein